MTSVLVVDTGSTSLRASVVEDGRVVSSAMRPTPTTVPDDAPTGQEWDAHVLWTAACDAIDEATQHHRPAAVVSTAQRLATAFLDESGTTLYVGPNTDARGFLESIEIQRSLGDRLYEIGGHQPPIVLAAPRLQWMRTHRPEIAARVACVLPLASWFGARLTGVRATDPSAASDTGLLDVAGRDWSDDLCGAMSVDRSLLPTMRRSADVLGELQAPPGLERLDGLPVVVGGGDTMCAMLGMGVVEHGQAGIVAGSTMPVDVVGDAPIPDPTRRCWHGCHVVDDRWLLEANSGESGIAQTWFGRLLGVAPEALHPMAAQVAAGAAPLAHVNPGPLDFSDLPLVRTGAIQFPVPLLVLGAPPATMARAFVENLAYVAAEGLRWVGEVVTVEDVAVGGGIAESAVFAQILAAVLARPVRRFGVDVTVRGAAALALQALGEAPPDAAAHGEVIEPDPAWVGVYDAGFTAWRAESERLTAPVARFSALLSG